LSARIVNGLQDGLENGKDGMMEKIPTYFDRDWNGDRSRVVPTVHRDCGWVADGEGVATRKLDGMCAAVLGGALFKRREIKHGAPDPIGFVKVSEDDETGKTVGWVPVGDAPEDRYFRDAWSDSKLPDGTYELVGPKVQGGAERLYSRHTLVRHDLRLALAEQPPRDFDGIRVWMEGQDIEGVVWHHPDGRMAKLKLRDFGLKRRVA
jgi:hypothetical protein